MRYPLQTLAVNEAFDVPIGSVGYKTLTAYMSKRGKDLGRRFSVRTIATEGVYEVSRLEDRPGVLATAPRRGADEPVVKTARLRDRDAEIAREVEGKWRELNGLK